MERWSEGVNKSINLAEERYELEKQKIRVGTKALEFVRGLSGRTRGAESGSTNTSEGISPTNDGSQGTEHPTQIVSETRISIL